MSLNHASRIPVTLVTGFLGSGKTTLINAGLKSPDLAKTVVVVNEFGAVGLDHQLYTSSNDAVVVLENGCLCCTVKSDLIATLNSLYHDRARGDLPDFNNVVIETTGLAEPGPVLQAFLSEPTLDGLYRVVNVVTVVDAVNWASTAEKHDEALRQAALADDILVSKLDLTDDGAFEDLNAQLQAMNPAARISRIDLNTDAVAPLLMHKGFDAADPMADPSEWLSIATYEGYEQKQDNTEGVTDQTVPQHLSAKGIESFVLHARRPHQPRGTGVPAGWHRPEPWAQPAARQRPDQHSGRTGNASRCAGRATPVAQCDLARKMAYSRRTHTYCFHHSGRCP